MTIRQMLVAQDLFWALVKPTLPLSGASLNQLAGDIDGGCGVRIYANGTIDTYTLRDEVTTVESTGTFWTGAIPFPTMYIRYIINSGETPGSSLTVNDWTLFNADHSVGLYAVTGWGGSPDNTNITIQLAADAAGAQVLTSGTFSMGLNY